jgi:hypothetical protein
MATKVSQATIDKIKKMGMTKALAGAKGANPEMKEALTRMYGAKRVSAAGGSAPKYTSADAARNVAIKTKPQMTDAGKKPRKLTQPKPTEKAFGVSVADWRKAYGQPTTVAKPKVKTAAQKAAEAKTTATRRKAAAAAIKAANGRTH